MHLEEHLVKTWRNNKEEGEKGVVNKEVEEEALEELLEPEHVVLGAVYATFIDVRRCVCSFVWIFFVYLLNVRDVLLVRVLYDMRIDCGCSMLAVCVVYVSYICLFSKFCVCLLYATCVCRHCASMFCRCCRCFLYDLFAPLELLFCF